MLRCYGFIVLLFCSLFECLCVCALDCVCVCVFVCLVVCVSLRVVVMPGLKHSMFLFGWLLVDVFDCLF